VDCNHLALDIHMLVTCDDVINSRMKLLEK